MRKTAFHELFPHQNRMRSAVSLIGLYQRSGLQTAVRKSGMLRVLPEHLRTMEAVLPDVPKSKDMKHRPRFLPSIGPMKNGSPFFGLLNGYNVFTDQQRHIEAFTAGRLRHCHSA